MKIQPGGDVTPNVRLVRPLGSGGMGAVWIAEHLGLHTLVAVKFLHGEHAKDEQLRARFSREASAAALVKSAHVVRVYDHGVTDDGTPFIVMELLEGHDLAKEITTNGPLQPAYVVMIVSQLAKALEQAHAKGVVHRDIKPENIFLTNEGGEVFVKLLDFGVAKSESLSRSKTTSDKSTTVGQILGTPFYMSLEQLKDSKDIDYRTDLYSLGVVVYEALTKQLPYQEETLAALAIAVSDGVYVPPSAINPALPRSFDAWFAKACARTPSERFQSAREMSDALKLATGVAREIDASSGAYKQVVIQPSTHDVAFNDATELAAAPARSTMRDTSFTTSGGSAPKPKSRVWIAAPAALVLFVALGIAGTWWARGRTEPKPAVSMTGVVTASAPSVASPPTTSTPQANVPTPSTSVATTTSASAPPAPRTPTAPRVVRDASAAPKGSHERDIW